MKSPLFDKWSVIVSISSLIFSVVLFFSYTSEFFFSLIAAILTGGLVWMTYIILRLIALALR